MMKKYLFSFILMAAVSFPAFAQSSEKEYYERYALLVNRLGADGVGVETLVNKWLADFPSDGNALVAQFNYYFLKSRSTQVLQKDGNKFLGADPVLTIKDSLGNDVHFFEEAFYDDSLFTMATQAIDKAISLYPKTLEYRFCKITALEGYEKGSPDMTLMTVNSLIDLYYSDSSMWTYNGEFVDDAFFRDAVQEYCLSFYLLGTPGTYEAFRNASEHMLRYNKNDVLFLGNLGTYYLVCKQDRKQAQKYYSNVLKVDPNNYAAIKNMVVIARKDKNVKLEKKYLPLLIKVTDDQAERMSSEARLKSLN